MFIDWSVNLNAQIIDLSRASVIVSNAIQSPVRETIIKVLQEETRQRTAILLPVVNEDSRKSTLIMLVLSRQEELNGIQIPHRSGENLPEFRKEGFRITFENSGIRKILWLIGNDERGFFTRSVIFYERLSVIRKDKVDRQSETAYFSGLSYPGHQLGYRDGNKYMGRMDCGAI